MRSGDQAAVLGASADNVVWNGVYAGAIESSVMFVRVGAAGGFTLGAPGEWRDVVLGNGSAAIDSNSSALCSNRSREACPSAGLPGHVAALIDRARQNGLCGWACRELTETTSRTATPTSTYTATSTSSPTETPTNTYTATPTTSATATPTTSQTTSPSTNQSSRPCGALKVPFSRHGALDC